MPIGEPELYTHISMEPVTGNGQGDGNAINRSDEGVGGVVGALGSRRVGIQVATRDGLDVDGWVASKTHGTVVLSVAAVVQSHDDAPGRAEG